MSLFTHHLKTSVRNLLNYKLQTAISVLSIAIGIVTLAFAHAALGRMKFPSLYSQPYYDRTYDVRLRPIEGGDSLAAAEGSGLPRTAFTFDIIRALKADGGPKCAERMGMPSGTIFSSYIKFHLCDSTMRKLPMHHTAIDPEYLTLIGLRSATTGLPLRKLKAGEAVISRQMADLLFEDKDPVGAVCYETSSSIRPVPITIVDIYEDLSYLDRPLDNTVTYYSLGDMEGNLCGAKEQDHLMYASWVNVVLKEDCNAEQLKQELDARLKPFGIAAELEKTDHTDDVQAVIMLNTLVHLFSSLILLAAIIGFLRMQVQLFWIRRREISLRVAHGAQRRQLFGLLFTEVMLVVGMAVAVAMPMAGWVETFFYTRFPEFACDATVAFHYLAYYSMGIGAVLLAVCAVVIWCVLQRICKAQQGLAAAMRGSRTHWFRNIMLGIQVTIAMLFVSSTFVMASWSKQMLRVFHLPDDLSDYKNCLWADVSLAEDAEGLSSELRQLPSVERTLRIESAWRYVQDIDENPVASNELGGSYQGFYTSADTSLAEFHRLPIKWFGKPGKNIRGILLNDSLYLRLRSLNLAADRTLTVRLQDSELHTLPILGTIPLMPYERSCPSIIIHPMFASTSQEFLLIPRPGRYAELEREAKQTIVQREPWCNVDDIVKNFHEKQTVVTLLESMSTVGWVLGAISLIICSMSIYSTIALDTRSRHKEVAIRKICGAKNRDIYRLFGRVYLLIILLALIIALPLAVLFNRMMFSDSIGDPQALAGASISPLVPCLAGSLTVIVLIAAIVLWNIRCTMLSNPAEIIAKE